MPAGSSPLLDDDFMRRVLQQYSVQQYLAPQQQAGLAAAAAAAGQPPTSQQADGSSGGSSNGAAPPPLVAPHFPLKHLNIVDPLLPSNNLGRSVSKASYARVRKALALGSRTLEAALLKVGAHRGGGVGVGGWRRTEEKWVQVEAVPGGLPCPHLDWRFRSPHHSAMPAFVVFSVSLVGAS